MVLAEAGFLVFRFDGRGTPGRGRAWLDPIYGDQMTKPMEDWRMAVERLRALPFVDSERLGIWGRVQVPNPLSQQAPNPDPKVRPSLKNPKTQFFGLGLTQ